MSRHVAFLLALSIALCASLPAFSVAAERPNILLVMADDLGFSDLGCYGSEIATPTLDRLAANGLRFMQFYNTAKCHSSRVSLLSGRWCRQAGDVGLGRAVTTAEVLGAGGYFTAMVGKWHLSKQPTDFGFQRYFGHLSGSCNYYRGDGTFRLNGEVWKVPDEGFYTTVANVDYALQFLGEARQAKQPWFLYVAFNAPHAPLQPLEEDYRRYLGKYDRGWDEVRAARFEKQRELGLFYPSLEASPRPDHIWAWDRLSPDMRTREGRRMAAYAALIDRVDQELGRLVADLERNGELDNTLILFFSDNGACPYDRRAISPDEEPFDPDVTWSDSTGWAWARNTPFRYYKQNQFEGGISSPGIMHWPAGLKTEPGALVNTPAHLVDVLPTLAAVAGVEVPVSWPDRDLSPVAGVSLAPILAGEALPNRPPIHLLFGEDRGLRDGDWKLVSFRRQPWELYNMAEDRTEQHNLSETHPEILERMVKQWHEMTANVLMAPEKEQQPVLDKATGHMHPEWTNFAAPNQGRAGRQADASASGSKDIRARVGTRLSIDGDTLFLECRGDDPGLALNTLPEMGDVGPYSLIFRAKSNALGMGELYWTTDASASLPQGGHLEFSVTHNAQWEEITIAIPETKRLYALRLDPCAGAGDVRIAGLTLKDAAGNVVETWP